MFTHSPRTPALPVKPPEGSSKAGYRRRLHKGLKAASSKSERKDALLANDMDLNDMDLLFELPPEQSTDEPTRARFSFDNDSSVEQGRHVDIRLKFNPSPRTTLRHFSRGKAEDKDFCTEPYEEEASGTAGKGSRGVVAGAGSLLRSLARDGVLFDSSNFATNERMFADPLMMLIADQGHFVKDEGASSSCAVQSAHMREQIL